MANRHLARSVVLQSLFEWDFNGYADNSLKRIVARNLEEFAPGLDDGFFVHQLVSGVAERREKLDLIIEKAAPEWPLEKIAVVDRNVLRLGLYELLFADRSEVPSRVAINEAIELAKTFGGENSGKFVNGVLGAVYHEMGEPGKTDPPAKHTQAPKDLPYEKLPLEQLVGAVVYYKNDQEIKLALVHDIFGYWTLSKGHLKEGELPYAGAARKAEEELGIKVEVGEKLGENEYLANSREQGKIRKQVNYFLARAASEWPLRLTQDSGLDDARWFPLGEVPELKIYEDVLPFITKAAKLLLKK